MLLLVLVEHFSYLVEVLVTRINFDVRLAPSVVYFFAAILAIITWLAAHSFSVLAFFLATSKHSSLSLQYLKFRSAPGRPLRG